MFILSLLRRAGTLIVPCFHPSPANVSSSQSFCKFPWQPLELAFR